MSDASERDGFPADDGSPVPAPLERGQTAEQGQDAGQGQTADERHETSRKKMRRGSAWALSGYAGIQVLRFGGNLLLWRLLSEDMFGVMALVNVFLQALEMFSDVGIGPSIIQNEKGDERDFLNTAWTIQVGRGVIIWLVACGLAWPVAWFYERPELVQLIPVVGLTSVFQGLYSSKIFTARRHVSLARVTMLEFGTQLVGTLAMIAWAAVYPSVWALAVGSIAGVLFKMVLSHSALPGLPNRLCFRRDHVRDLVAFGRWIFLSTLLTFVALHSDRIIFGKLVSISELGVYSIAQIYATLPVFLMGHIMSDVVFPTLSQHRMAGDELGAVFGRVRMTVLMFAGYLITCLLAGGPTLIEFLYDERALAAGWMVQALSLGSWFIALEAINNALILAIGKPYWTAAAHGAKVVGLIALIPLGHSLYGFPGAVLGFACADFFKYFVSMVAVERESIRMRRQDLGLSCMVVAASGCGLGVAMLAQSFDVHVFVRGVLVFLMVTAWWGALYLWNRRRG